MEARPIVPKLCGSDTELANFFLGAPELFPGGSGLEAARALLREIPGIAADPIRDGDSGERREESRDWGRKFLPSNGGAAYIDLGHLEICTPETRGAFDHLAAFQAMLQVAREAWRSAQERLPDQLALKVLANNSDGRGHSYGGHLSFLLSRRAWEDIFHRRLHHLLFLASHFCSAIIYSGSGKVGCENGAPPSGFQLSQRADFFETLVGPETTFARPIVNSRDEPLGCREERARLHVIFFDTTLAHRATVLKTGATQIVLAMLEAGLLEEAEGRLAGRGLLLDDPLDALRVWSRDPSLRAAAPLLSGETRRAVEVQRSILELAARFVGDGRVAEAVPRAEEIIRLWEETLDALERDPRSLAGSLDWAGKLQLLESAREELGVGWEAPAIRYLDQIYHSLDPDEGLHWLREQAGETEALVSPGTIERAVHEPPAGTRAWTRAHLLRRAGAGAVERVDWDRIELRPEALGLGPPMDAFNRPDHFTLTDPLAHGRAQAAPAFDRPLGLARLLEALRESSGGERL